MDDFSRCMLSNTRMAARAITRRYDACARPHGITATQFSLLGLVLEAQGRNVTELATARGFERTTLTRNLDRLEQQGLIASAPARHGNGRVAEPTEKGRELATVLLPVWRKAQADLLSELGPDGFDDTLAKLKRLASL